MKSIVKTPTVELAPSAAGRAVAALPWCPE